MPNTKIILALITCLLLCTGCTQADKEGNIRYIEPIIAKIKVGLSIAETISVIKKYDEDFQIYNPCIESFENKITNCEQGYTAISNIPLPNHNFWLGQGSAQIYLSFNSKKYLVKKFHEIHYENYHI